MASEPADPQATRNSVMAFFSTKTYTHAEGLSCCFRQWRASHSHCRFLHGYSLEVEISFVATELDARHWVVDFGGMKEVKAFLHETFDHRALVAADDPELARFHDLASAGLVDLRVLPDVGCEAFASLIYEFTAGWLRTSEPSGRVVVASVEVREHEGNSARFVPDERSMRSA